MTSPYHRSLRELSTFFGNGPAGQRSGDAEDLRTTPLFSLRVGFAVDHHHFDDFMDASTTSSDQSEGERSSANTSDLTSSKSSEKAHVKRFPQWSLLGRHVGSHPDIESDQPILLNTRVPASTFICGSQGSGKSYTLSCMLENYLKPNSTISAVGQSMAGLVFHYDTDSSSGVAEAAGLCSLGIRTRVLVPPTSFHQLQQKYMDIADAKDKLKVMPLYFQGHHLTIERMLKLMAFVDADGNVPLYVSVVINILRSLALKNPGEPLDYKRFKKELESNKDFATNQSSMLRLRLDLLESCLASTATNLKGQKPAKADFVSLVEPGTLTIVDMSCPLVDKASARVFFDIVLGIFKEYRPQAGLVVALDEAHKFMDDSAGSTSFTDRLMATIREQRHVATRVLIATQEPTISPRLLDLCNISIIHRFNSPAWLAAIKNHLGAAQLHEQQDAAEGGGGLMQQIMQLGVGESLVFAPSAHVCMRDEEPKMLQNGIMKMQTRRRLGNDQGLSKLADAQS